MLTEVTENYAFDSDGTMRVTRSQDVQSLIDQNKHEADAAPSMFGQAAVRKIAETLQ